MNTQPVIEGHSVYSEKEIRCQYNATVVCRMDRCTRCRAKICACMRCARFAVEDAAVTEVRTRTSGNRNREWLSPECFAPDHCIYRFQFCGFPSGASEIGFAQLDVLFLDRQFCGRILLLDDLNECFSLVYMPVFSGE